TASDLFRVAFGRAATAELPVEVSASDLTGLKMTLNAGVRVSLRVSIEGRELSSFPDFEKIRVGLRPRRGQWIGGTRQQGPLGSDGAGAIDYVGNGEYRVWIDEGISDLYIKEATIEDVDVLNGFWKLSGTPTGALRIALGDKPGRVEGTLTDASSKPVPGVQVVLIPEKLRYRDELYKTVDTDEKGRFGFRAIAPGDYRIFAWEALEPFAYFNPELLSKYEQQGQFVHVSEASQQTVDVKMIPAPKD
ncbi:MAG TPA: carboxypeptidase-like regulatory domain-containing protein, partial [Terriglobia bacterium]|nr:carboxypeptidase-like regulatory domain-containing protein [Terriglobia bacterium]